MSKPARKFVKALVMERFHPGENPHEYHAAAQLALRQISVALQIGNAAVLRNGMVETVVRIHGAARVD